METPTISIIAERIRFRNITIDELSRLQSDNIRYIFSDFDFNFENKTGIIIGNNTAIKSLYTVVDPFTKYRDSLVIKMVWKYGRSEEILYTLYHILENKIYTLGTCLKYKV